MQGEQLGTAAVLEGDPAAAMADIDRGFELTRGRGDRLSTYVALYNLPQAALALGDDATARHHVEEGIRLSEQTRDLANLAFFLAPRSAATPLPRQSSRGRGLGRTGLVAAVLPDRGH